MIRNRNKMSYEMIYCGDCLKVMPEMDAASVDAIVTDPPYGLSFMGRDWDHGVPGEAFWREALRVAKPGTHLLAFGGTRTYHRLACAIEDAGWEVRDCIMWVYGSGFPKSLDVSKAIDKAAGAEREVVGRAKGRGSNSGEGRYNWNSPRDKVDRTWYDATSPATDLARKWSGWGTALKPAWEPVIVARKPLAGTVAANVIQHGTGAINVDGCRIALNGDYKCKANGRPSQTGLGDNYDPDSANQPDTVGRWPANLIHDGSEEVVAGFPEPRWVNGDEHEPGYWHAPAARFFYCAKASKADRDAGVAGVAGVGALRDGGRESLPRKNHHPTVKPTALMRYLCRLVTPPGGVVLDPFAGSGSTGKAAVLEGFSFIGIELNAEYVEIARARIENAKKKSAKKKSAKKKSAKKKSMQ